tara:strand:- start:658 stop:1383 length:726 start_codon:yes stop_codon:yes gene_type:complete
MSSIEFDHISKFYNQNRVVDDVSLVLPVSQTTAIVGESGSGKSTLLQIVNGLVIADEGTVKIAGAEIDYDALPRIRRNMGYAVQGAGLFPHLTIKQNVTLVAHLAGWARAELDERYVSLLSVFGLDDELSDRYPHSLSGGQQQRVGLCRAMMLDPPLLLLDEPFSALDPITRESVHEEMLQLIDGEKSILLVTHDMQEALKLANYLVILKDGKVVQQGAPEEVANQPVDDYVARFFGGANA